MKGLVWPVRKLVDVCEKVSVGHVGPTTEFFCAPEVGVPLVRSQNVRPGRLRLKESAYVTDTFHQTHRNSQLQAGDILIVRVGANRGDVCAVPAGVGPINCANIVFARPVDKSGFLSYYFRSEEARALLIAGTTGSAQGVINTGTIANLTVPDPPEATKHQIVAILAAYDDLIENCERRIRILDEMARKLYREWFVHFRYPGHENVPLVDSALGKIPKGWRCDTFDKIAIVHRGRSYRSEDMAENGGVPFINLKCIDRDGGFRRSGIKRFVGAKPEAHAVRQGDIVMAVTDMTQERRIVARAALVPTLDGGYGVVSMDLVRIEPHTEYPTGWLFAHLRYSTFADHLKQHANGANVLHLSPDRIRAYEAVIPSTHIVRSFDSTISPLLAIQNQLTDRVANLRRTRDLLLPRLLSGQLDVGAMV